MAPIPDAYTDGRQYFAAVDGFHFHIGARGSGLMITVPAGYVTDRVSWPPKWFSRLLALVPPLWRWVLAVLEQMAAAAAVHDRMREDRQFTLLEGDCLFWIALRCLQVPRGLDLIAFLAVRTNKSRVNHQPGLIAPQ